MNPKEKRKAYQWLQKQSRDVVFDLPDKRPDEAPATKKQKDYIRGMTSVIDEDALADLGKWQAADLIDQIKHEKELLSQQAAIDYVRQEARRAFVWKIVLVAILGAIIWGSFRVILR
jgi:hypothetical protein